MAETIWRIFSAPLTVKPSGECRYFSNCVARVLPPADWPGTCNIFASWDHAAMPNRGQSTAGLASGCLGSSRKRFSMNSRLLTTTGGIESKVE
ncbi:hypothetical protein D3C79_872190 [compost metagenome]